MCSGVFHRALFVLCFLCACVLSSAELSIRVVDSANSRPLEDASVSISGKASARLSGASVSFKDLESGDYIMKAEAPSYESKSGKIRIDNTVKSSYSGTFKLNRKKPQLAETAPTEPPVESPSSLFSWQEPDPVPANGTSMRSMQSSKKKASEILDAAGISVPAENRSPIVLGSEENKIESGISYTVVFVVIAVLAMMASFVFIGIFILGRKSLSGVLKVLLLGGMAFCDFLVIAAAVAAFVCYQSGEKKTQELPLKSEPVKVNSAKAPDKAAEMSESVQDKLERKRQAASLYKLGTAILRNPELEQRSPDFDKALSMLEDAFAMDPDNDIYALDLADVYIRNSTTMSIGLASSIYEGMLDRLPENDMILARLADSYARGHRYEDAFRTAFRRTWNRNLSPLNAASQIVLFAIVSGETSRGIALLVPLVSKFPAEAPQVKLMIAGLLAEDGNKDGALGLIDSTLKDLPESDPFTKDVLTIRKEVEAK